MKKQSFLFALLCAFTMIFAVSCADGIKYSADKLTSGSGDSNSGYNGGWDDDDDDDTSNGENPFKGTTWLCDTNQMNLYFSSNGKTVEYYSQSYIYEVSGNYDAKMYLAASYEYVKIAQFTFSIDGKDATSGTLKPNGQSVGFSYTKQ